MSSKKMHFFEKSDFILRCALWLFLNRVVTLGVAGLERDSIVFLLLFCELSPDMRFLPIFCGLFVALSSQISA